MSTYAQLRWEYEVISGEQAAHDFAAMFGAEIQALAEWINRAPESVDVEAVFERIDDSTKTLESILVNISNEEERELFKKLVQMNLYLE